VKLNYRDRNIEVFSLVPRAARSEQFWPNVLEVTRLSDEYRCSGVLIFNGNEIVVEPWFIAQTMAAHSRELMPLVAVNPVYMHPFSVARMVSSLSLAYRRRVFLNLITGTSLSHLQALGDDIEHDRRYERLLEFTQIVTALLGGYPLDFDGQFYKTKGLQLLPALAEDMRPQYLLAGQSSAAVEVAEKMGAVNIQMLGPRLESQLGSAQAIHFGLIAREDEQRAWYAAQQRFPEDKVGQFVLSESMHNTDSQWKRRLQLAATQQSSALPGFWMLPFRNMQADCPYFVGSHERAAALVAALVRAGIHTFVLDIPLDEQEFNHTARVFRRASGMLVD